jgi:hypothetical protein
MSTIAEQHWESLGNVPIDNDGHIEIDWHMFPAGTHREEIWHWFEEQFNVRVHDLMFPNERRI